MATCLTLSNSEDSAIMAAAAVDPHFCRQPCSRTGSLYSDLQDE